LEIVHNGDSFVSNSGTFMTNVKKRDSIINGIDILKSLSEGMDKVTDLARQHGLTKSSTHRILRSLKNTSIVRRDPITRRYYRAFGVTPSFQADYLSSRIDCSII
jgi:hypothetical protein